MTTRTWNVHAGSTDVEVIGCDGHLAARFEGVERAPSNAETDGLFYALDWEEAPRLSVDARTAPRIAIVGGPEVLAEGLVRGLEGAGALCQRSEAGDLPFLVGQVDDVVYLGACGGEDTLDAEHGCGRVNEDRHVERGGCLPHRDQPPVVQITTVHTRADLHAAEAEPGRALELLHGQVGRLQGNDGGPEKAVGPLGHEGGDGVVVEPAELRGRLGGRPVTEHERRRGQHLPLDAEAVWARQLYVLYVHAADHGTGAGPALLRAVLDQAEPAALWVADPNPRAQAFYRRNGFVADGTTQVQDGVREIRMLREVYARLVRAAEEELPGEGTRKAERLHERVVRDWPALSTLGPGDRTEGGAVSGERLTSALAAWSSELLREAELVVPGSAPRILGAATRDHRHALQAAGYFDQVPWSPSR